MKLLVANRGEIAIRIMRAAAELGVPTVAVATSDDVTSLHTGKADEFVALDGNGASAYLDIHQLVMIAKECGCDAIHPGYGFLSENGDFAAACVDAGLTFVGPNVETLRLFGNKARAREAATAASVPIIPGIDHAVSLSEAELFFNELGDGRAMMIKAVGGGGGRGSRLVHSADEVENNFERCQAEAKAAFGNPDVYVEEFFDHARHIEVQILGDATGAVIHLHERECSVQRRFQKLIEVAPAPALSEEIRTAIIEASLRFAKRVNYCNAGTFEYLVDLSGQEERFAFIETNARLQVEHTVSEEITGVDLVKAQLRIAGGETLEDLGLAEPIEPRGYAIQARVCMESMQANGEVLPTQGVLSAYEPPSGPGIRTDSFGYSGYETSLNYDSLLAKVIGYSSSADIDSAISRTSRALSEFRVDGVETNIGLLQTILHHPNFSTGAIHTRFMDEHVAELVSSEAPRRLVSPYQSTESSSSTDGYAGARVEDARDPLALFDHDSRVKSELPEAEESEQNKPIEVRAKLPGLVTQVSVNAGDRVVTRQPLLTIRSLEIDHLIRAERGGQIESVFVSDGTSVQANDLLFRIVSSSIEGIWEESRPATVLDHRRSDLALVDERRTYIQDDFRAEKIARRHLKEQRSPKENIDHLMDGTFREYGPLVTAASWQDQEWLRETTQADGLVMGIGNINGDLFDDDQSRSVVVHYDYMVVAGTQGGRGHYKQDRIYELAGRYRLPLVLFAEGGGGRPGISGGTRAERRDIALEAGLRKPGDEPPRSRSTLVDVAGRGGGGVPVDSYTFTKLCDLSGLVPLVGVNSGRCFAGNTVMLASCDVIIAAENSTIGLGGPAMIEGGGLGIYTPEEVGPMSFQVPNGVVDILVKDDEAAIECTKKYLSYFQGAIPHWHEPDQRLLRHVVPENRNESYDMRELIAILADEDSILEIREAFGLSIITAFIRIEGRPLGLIANNPMHLSGAIDSDSADKGARFLQLCDAFDIPVLSLIDCPGTMSGPAYEQNALVRHFGRLLVTGANMTTASFSVVIRKAYGMGARAMCGGSTLEPFFSVAWPTAEFAETTLSAHIELMYGEELNQVQDVAERSAIQKRLLDSHVDMASAVKA
ncbi:MAG: carbamoyl-phosphate synthase large subunit, partial [Gammaproteobacteria bacterium]|nr:carbamoyl-phosphate synthase large subunit [Gammaproteobacteria bacterium]